jgi:hypothetical protein
MPVLLLGNIFLLLCNENIRFNRIKNIVFVLLSQDYLIKEIENIFFLCFYRVIETLVL